MAKRGPAPKPSALKVLHGSRLPISDREPMPTVGVPPMPDFLDDTAQRYWHRLAPQLQELGVLTVVDGEALAGYCVALSRLAQAEALLQDQGLTVLDRQGKPTKHPAVNILKDCLALVKAYAAEFGLTPASRTRVTVAVKPQRETKKEALAKKLGLL